MEDPNKSSSGGARVTKSILIRERLIGEVGESWCNRLQELANNQTFHDAI